MLVELERPPDEGVELPHQEIGQVKGGGLVMGGEAIVALEEGIAVRPLHHVDAEPVAG